MGVALDPKTSSPNWAGTNLGDRGRRKTPAPTETLWALITSNLPEEQKRTPPPVCNDSPSITGPCLKDAHPSYYGRRGTLANRENPQSGYRRHLHHVERKPAVERQLGKRVGPAPERKEKIPAVRHRPFDNSLLGPEYRQPDAFRMGREHAKPCTSQCEAELALDQELCRKGRTHPESLKGSGRAGDLSKRSGTCERVQEQYDYGHKRVDNPATARFAAGMAANAVHINMSPTEAQQRQANDLRDAKAAVANLDSGPDGSNAEEV